MSRKTAKVTVSMEPELRDAFKRRGIEISPLVYNFLRSYALKHHLIRESGGLPPPEKPLPLQVEG